MWITSSRCFSFLAVCAPESLPAEISCSKSRRSNPRGQSLQACPPAIANDLRASALFYRSVDHAIRLITGHSARRDPEPALAARVESLLRRWNITVRDKHYHVRQELRVMREETRALYEKIWTGET